MTHDYIRNGTTTLFAVLNVLDGTITGQCMARHRHQEFIHFLNRIEAAVPAGKLVHAILDNYAAHKHPKESFSAYLVFPAASGPGQNREDAFPPCCADPVARTNNAGEKMHRRAGGLYPF